MRQRKRADLQPVPHARDEVQVDEYERAELDRRQPVDEVPAAAAPRRCACRRSANEGARGAAPLTRPLSPGADVARSCADGAPKAKGAYGWCSSIFDLLSAGRSRKIRKIDAHFNSLPQQHRDCAHACHTSTGTALTPATSAPGLRSPKELDRIVLRLVQ